MQRIRSSFVADIPRITNRNVKSSCLWGVWKRWRKKKLNVKTGCDLALEHFDTFYRPVYGDLWPSIRISLLTRKKTAAVLNNHANYTEDLHSKFAGTYDMVQDAASILDERMSSMKPTYTDSRSKTEASHAELPVDGFAERISLSSYMSVSEKGEIHDHLNVSEVEIGLSEKKPAETDKLNIVDNASRTDLNVFVPAKNVYSERDFLQMEEARQNIYTPGNVKVNFTHRLDWKLPGDVHVKVYPQGDIRTFPDPKGSLLTHFMMDAASVLPVIALDLQEDDHVLDLCAAPGGKTLVMLQTRLPEKVTCIDNSLSRLKRLSNMLRYYLPSNVLQSVETLLKDGRELDNINTYDKVLVDVPCNTDRHYLTEPVNNLFANLRMKERLSLPILQKELLLAGIKSCAPGGSIVYSTCTLSFAQNDGVIQQVIDEIWKSTNIDIAIEDLTPLRNLFKNTFRFYEGCRFGQKVPVLIDGAHALGSLPLNLHSLQPDYYVSNAHKWLCCPKGSAFMYVRKEHQNQTRPLIVSHGFGSGFSSEYIWTGLHDYSPYLALHTVIDFWNTVGCDNIRQYMYKLCQQAADLLTKAWNTSSAAPSDMFGSMCLIELPAKLYQHLDVMDYSAAESIQNKLYHSFNIEVPIKCVQKKLYVRISAHIYNELSEYQLLADAVLKMMNG